MVLAHCTQTDWQKKSPHSLCMGSGSFTAQSMLGYQANRQCQEGFKKCKNCLFGGFPQDAISTSTHLPFIVLHKGPHPRYWAKDQNRYILHIFSLSSSVFKYTTGIVTHKGYSAFAVFLGRWVGKTLSGTRPWQASVLSSGRTQVMKVMALWMLPL